MRKVTQSKVCRHGGQTGQQLRALSFRTKGTADGGADDLSGDTPADDEYHIAFLEDEADGNATTDRPSSISIDSGGETVAGSNSSGSIDTAAERSADAPQTVPRIIHQTWVDANVPAMFRDWPARPLALGPVIMLMISAIIHSLNAQATSC